MFFWKPQYLIQSISFTCFLQMLEWNLGHRWQCVVRWTACIVGKTHSNPFLCRLPLHMVGLDKPCHQLRDSPHLQLPLGLSSYSYMGLLGLDPLNRGLVTSLSTMCHYNSVFLLNPGELVFYHIFLKIGVLFSNLMSPILTYCCHLPPIFCVFE